jgi:ribosomal protein L11 methyltransferase
MLYEISIRFKDPDGGKSPLIVECLKRLDVDPSEVVENRSGATGEIFFYSGNRIKADFFAKRIRKAGLKGIEVSVRGLKDADWKSKWTENYHPFNITEEIRIVPYGSLRNGNIDRGKDIIIRTDIIFGSGLHETTEHMAYFIRSKRGHINSFLDVGTGTGLLSIIAGKYGARKIFCFDVDEDAVKNAEFNFKINNIKPDSLRVSGLRSYRCVRVFDFVAANLLTRDLLEMKDKLMRFIAPKGYLAVSGVSLDNYDEFRDKFRPGGLKCLKVRKGKQWTGILYKKK